MNVISWRERPNGDHVDRYGKVLSTRKSRALEDIPEWKKFEIDRLEEVNGLIIPGRNALPKDWKEFGHNADELGVYRTERPSVDAKVVADVPPEPLLSFLSYANERIHGWDHQLKWCRMLLATDYDWGGHAALNNVFEEAEYLGPLTYEECLKFYERHGRNARWTQAKDWFEDNDDLGPPPIPPVDWMDYVEDDMAVAIADLDWDEVARLAALKSERQKT